MFFGAYVWWVESIVENSGESEYACLSCRKWLASEKISHFHGNRRFFKDLGYTFQTLIPKKNES